LETAWARYLGVLSKLPLAVTKFRCNQQTLAPPGLHRSRSARDATKDAHSQAGRGARTGCQTAARAECLARRDNIAETAVRFSVPSFTNVALFCDRFAEDRLGSEGCAAKLTGIAIGSPDILRARFCSTVAVGEVVAVDATTGQELIRRTRYGKWNGIRRNCWPGSLGTGSGPGGQGVRARSPFSAG
jgi:hypothetical protein